MPRTLGEARLALLRAEGLTLSALARELERDVSLVSRVVAGKQRSRFVEQALARKLGMQLWALFPERFAKRVA